MPAAHREPPAIRPRPARPRLPGALFGWAASENSVRRETAEKYSDAGAVLPCCCCDTKSQLYGALADTSPSSSSSSSLAAPACATVLSIDGEYGAAATLAPQIESALPNVGVEKGPSCLLLASLFGVAG